VPREEFQHQLDELQDDVLRMGDVVTTRLQKTLTALEERDTALARRIANSDHEVNELYLELENECIELFALQQPVATDLRIVAASFKILTDLERIADLAANLAAYVVDAEGRHSVDVDFVGLGETAADMVAEALAAYANTDVDRCHRVAERDDDLDGRCERVAQQIIRDLVARDPDPDEFEALLADVNRLLLTIRDLERVGDHAVNIAARTLYMVESDDTLLY
jgi:phosphate transport system protein